MTGSGNGTTSSHGALAWDRGAALRWPHRHASRFVMAGGMRWHVQHMGPDAQVQRAGPGPDARQMGAQSAAQQAGPQPAVQPPGLGPATGSAPVMLLLHGTGASTHSWRNLLPLLARRFHVVAMDLPGHAFSGSLPADQMSLPGMARAVAALVDSMALDVCVLVGHSAGAAIAARMVLDGLVRRPALAGSAPVRSASSDAAIGASAGPLASAAQHATPRSTTPHLVALNGAFLPFAGLPGLLFPPVARLMAATPLAAHWFARRDWNDAALRRLIGGTGSVLDDDGLAQYGALLRDPRHAAGALAMMSRWDLRALQQALPALRTPVSLIVGANDRAVPPADAARVCRLLPPQAQCRVHSVPDAGHLVHEERPDDVARLILAAVD